MYRTFRSAALFFFLLLACLSCGTPPPASTTRTPGAGSVVVLPAAARETAPEPEPKPAVEQPAPDFIAPVVIVQKPSHPRIAAPERLDRPEDPGTLFFETERSPVVAAPSEKEATPEVVLPEPSVPERTEAAAEENEPPRGEWEEETVSLQSGPAAEPVRSLEPANPVLASVPEPGKIQPVLPAVHLPKPDPVESLLSTLTLTERIGQRFFIWIRSKSELTHTKELIRKGRPAGIIVYPKNFKTYDELAQVILELKATAASVKPRIDLFVAADQEGGRVSAFHFTETFGFPAPWYWTMYGDPGFVEAAAYLLGTEMKRLGFNMDLAPVLDLYGKPDTSIIGDRSPGADPDKTAWYARSYMDGLTAAGIIPVAKHFPGHGVTETDTHDRLPVSDLSEDALLSRDIVPFKAAIDHGLQAIMTSHILFSRLDRDNPVTFSPSIVGNLLRGKLGYRGIVITDALEMGAISKNWAIDETLVRVMRAGVDIALVAGTYDLLEMERSLERAAKAGRLTEDEINEGARRVLGLKYTSGLIPPTDR